MGLSILSIYKLKALRKLSHCNVLFQKVLKTAAWPNSWICQFSLVDVSKHTMYIRRIVFSKFTGFRKSQPGEAMNILIMLPLFSKSYTIFPFKTNIPVFHTSFIIILQPSSIFDCSINPYIFFLFSFLFLLVNGPMVVDQFPWINFFFFKKIIQWNPHNYYGHQENAWWFLPDDQKKWLY